MTNEKEETAISKGVKPKAEKTVEKEPVMYVGPTVNGIGIQNRVYTEIPKEAQVPVSYTHLTLPTTSRV